MSKHWTPRIVPGGPAKGWAGQWDRHRWPVKGQRRRRIRRIGRDIVLMTLAGLLIGAALFAAMIWWDRSGGGDRPGADLVTQADPAAVRVIDGDTFVYGGTRIRIADIDTPEIQGRCAFETGLAARATSRMRALLAAGPFELHSIAGRDEDRYGRKLRIVTRGGRSLGDQLVAEGLARTWSGRREPWC